MNINVHIERLILDNIGIKSHQKNELKTAVETELRQELVSQGIGFMLESNENRQSVRGRSISIENIPNPTSLGQQIANAVYKGIGE